MILQALHQLYDRLADDEGYGIAPPEHSVQKITFKVVLRPNGDLFEIVDTRDHGGPRPEPKRVRVLGNNKPPGSGVNPCFLWDNSGYMLGYKVDDPKPDRTRRTFDAFRALHLERESAVGVPEYTAVCRFLESWDPDRHAEKHEVLKEAGSTGFGVFQIVGQTRFVHQDPRVEAWWQKQMATSDVGTISQCLITGLEAPVAKIHDKIRGVVGGQGSGGTIVGFNESAYESHGKQQSFNAPVSEAAAFRYVAALNSLLDGPKKRKHRLILSDTTVAFWTGQPATFEDIFLEVLSRGSEIADNEESQDESRRQQIQFLMEAIRKGRPGPELVQNPDSTDVFVLGLSPNSARIAVRFFYRGSVADLVDKVHRHQRDIGLLPQPGTDRRRGDPEFPSIPSLLEQTARERKDIPPLLEGALLQAVLTGTPYPHALFAAVLRRIRADRRVDYLRCCVLKGYLTRNLNQEVSMALDPDRPDPAYRLGRLFSALEKTQRDALGESLNKTIRDSFYSSASATPGSVFPRLLRTYQHHLAKLEGGHRVNRERLVQEVLAPMEGFPTHLSLADQGLFAIGYYHQTRDFYTKRANGDAS